MLSRFSNFVGPLSVFYGLNETPYIPPNLILSLDSASASSYKINGGSIEFNGSSGYLESPYYGDFQFGTNNFTIELWFYKNTVSPTRDMGLVSNQPVSGSGTGVRFYIGNNNRLYGLLYDGTNFGYINHPTTITDNEWHHAALVRNGTSISLYLDGSEYTIIAPIANINESPNLNLVVGRPFNDSSEGYFKGLITNVRVSNTAIYTSNFTPSTSQMQTDANTKLLLLSVDALTLTYDSSASPPKEVLSTNLVWNPNTPITSASTYPVIWKDTSGNNHNYTFFTFSSVLKEFGNTINLTSGNFLIGSTLGLLEKFTIDAWVNLRQTQDAAQIFTDLFDGGDINYFLGFLGSQINGGFFKSGGIGFVDTGDYTPTLHKWYNFTVTYDKQNLDLFINGETFSTLQSTVTPGYSNQATFIGKKWDDNSTVDGYFSIVNVWDGALTYSTINSNYNNLLDRFTYVLEVDSSSWDASASNITDLRNNLIGTVSNIDYTSDYGGVFSFTQSSYVNFGNPESLNQNGDISFFIWVKFDSFTTAYNVLSKHYGGGENDFQFSVKESTGTGTGARKMNFYTQNNYGVPGNPYAGLFDDTEILTDRWYLLGFTLENGGDLTYYIDGITSSVFTNITRQRVNNDFIIGSGDLNDGISGKVGDFVMYNRKLTPSEVLNYYNQSSPRFVFIENGLLVYLDATNQASYSGGNIWYDLSGNGYDATLYNGYTFSNDNSGVVQFDGYGVQYNPSVCSRGELNIDLRFSNNTIMYGTRFLQNTPGYSPSGRSLGGKDINWLLGTWFNRTAQFYTPASGFVNGPNQTDLDWHIYTGRFGTATSFWDNDIKLVASHSPNAVGPNGLVLGSDGVYGESSNCQISFLVVYNRHLTDEEILKNYNHFKGRLQLT